MSILPPELTSYFADSQLTWESYNRHDRRFVVRIEKEIGGETGLICFLNVSYVALPERFSGDGISSYPQSTWQESWLRRGMSLDYFEADDVLFEIFDQNGPSHYIVAKGLEYEILS